MEGFVKIRLRPHLRRLITRVIALLPAVVVISISGDQGTYQLLIFSQVILSLQLPFAIVPLVHFTSDKLKMGSFASKLWVKVLAWITSAIIMALNGKLVYDQVMAWITGDGPLMLSIAAVLAAAAISLFLAYIIILPLVRGERGWIEEKTDDALAIIEGIATQRVRHIAAALGRDQNDTARRQPRPVPGQGGKGPVDPYPCGRFRPGACLQQRLSMMNTPVTTSTI